MLPHRHADGYALQIQDEVGECGGSSFSYDVSARILHSNTHPKDRDYSEIGHRLFCV